jgi:hypothetical protein
MTDKIYKLILRGEFTEGSDIEIVHEKLAIIFDIDLKKIPKLLKKPTVIRKNLTPEVALQYREGLEKIGLLCDISPKLRSEPILIDAEPSQVGFDEAEEFSLIGVEGEKTLILDSNTLRVININIPFGAMVILVIKSFFASIPALIILGGIGYAGYLFQPMILEMLRSVLSN